MSIEMNVEDGIATITINRQEHLNALDAAAYRELSIAWTRVRDDREIKVAIITGAGDKSFSTGADLKDDDAVNAERLSDLWLTQNGQILNRGLEIWKPVIAAVNGHCLGAGMTLMLATDIRVASPNATFSLPEVKHGFLAANGGTQRILKQLPYAVGMEMLLTGDTINAVTAERWGIINRIVPGPELLTVAAEIARRIALNAPLAVQATKELAVKSMDMSLREGLRLEQMMSHALQSTRDAAEATTAFRERRPPQFVGN